MCLMLCLTFQGRSWRRSRHRKTIVACEDAFRLATAGNKTALLCLGDKLAFHLRQRMESSGVLVMTFPDLCQHYASVAGLNVNLTPTDLLETGPDLLAKAVLKDPTLRLDAIVVDEARTSERSGGLPLKTFSWTRRRLKYTHSTTQIRACTETLRANLPRFNVVPIRLSRQSA